MEVSPLDRRERRREQEMWRRLSARAGMEIERVAREDMDAGGLRRVPMVVWLQTYTEGRGAQEKVRRHICFQAGILPVRDWAASREQQEAVHAIAVQSGLERCALYVFADGNEVTLPVFGKTARQFANRTIRERNLCTVDRGKRSGLWYCRVGDWPLVNVRRKRYCQRRVPPPWHYLLPAELAGPEPDYSALDIGPDRLPPVYVCNLCGRSAPKSEWRWLPGLLGDYISGCPECGAGGKEAFKRIAENDAEGFLPTLRMQDDFLLTV